MGNLSEINNTLLYPINDNGFVDAFICNNCRNLLVGTIKKCNDCGCEELIKIEITIESYNGFL